MQGPPCPRLLLMPEVLPPWLHNLIGTDAAFWLAYLTNGKHLAFYQSFQITVLAAVSGAFLALCFGLAGATLRGSRLAPLRIAGSIYANIVRGVPDVLFFLFFPLAFEQGVEWLNAKR